MNTEAAEIHAEADAMEAIRERSPRASGLEARLLEAAMHAPHGSPERVQLECQAISLRSWIEKSPRDVTDEEARMVEDVLRKAGR